MGQVATVEERNNALAVQDEAFLSLIERAAMNPDVDVAKLERLYELNERRQAKAAETAYYAAMNALQAELPVIEHTKKIGYTDKSGKEVVKGTYTPWEDIDEQIRPTYIKHGFSLSFEIDNSGEGISVSVIIMHAGGHKVQYRPMRLPPDPSGSKNAAQAIGSAVSYAKRYSACLALNITTRGAEGETEDDDGEKAVQPMTAHAARKHGLWEKLETEFLEECATQSEAQEWLLRTKQYRQEYRAMPHQWRQYFYEEVFLPRLEKMRP